MRTTKDYTNALLNFNILVYGELTFKTKEDFNTTGELGKSVLEFNHTTTLMEKFNSL